MKKMALNITLCVMACAALGAMGLMGACGGDATDDDVATFVEGIRNTQNYEGSFTYDYTYTSGGSVPASGDSAGGTSVSGKYVTYNEDTGAMVIKDTSGVIENYTYFVKDDEGNLEEYTDKSDTESVVSKPAESTYNTYSALSGCISLASVSDDGTTNDVKQYMLKTVGSSYSGNYKDAALTVSGKTFKLSYEVVEELVGSSTVEVTFKFGSNGLTEISFTEETGIGGSNFSVATSDTKSYKISYSYTSSMMPKNFDDFA